MEFFEGIEYREISPPVVNHKENKINTIHIASYECSRKCTNWELMEYPANIIIPDEIAKFLKQGFVLAGGAIIDLIEKREPKDWDLFILTSTNLNFISNFGEYETKNSISSGKIQIIKRIYNSINEIIGGFDMDASRFVISNYRVLCTPSAYLALKTKKIYVNLNCRSETFGYRLNKYERHKGFSIYSIEEINRKNEKSGSFDYGLCLKSNTHIKSRTVELRENLMFLMKEQYSRLYKTKENSFTIKDFLNLINYICEKENGRQDFYGGGSGYPYTPRFVSYCADKGIKKIRLTSFVYNIIKFENREYQLDLKNMKKIRINCLKQRFHFYEDITTYKISNPTTQFTGSFYPLPYKYKIDLLTYIPEFIYIYIGLKKNGVHKYVRYLILMFYYNFHIKDIISS